MELFLDVLGETLVDTAKMLPFLFLAYLLIEYIEHRHGERIEALLAGGGRWGAVPGAVLGCVPQCGFSAIASNFYASRVITLGTLMAVYLATSDEAIPLLVSMPAYWDKLAVLMVIKVLYAIVVGFVLDFVLRSVLPKGLRGGYTGHADEVDCHEEHSDAEGNEKPIWQAALRHTLEIFVFIFVFSLVFGMIVEGVGEDVFAEVLGGQKPTIKVRSMVSRWGVCAMTKRQITFALQLYNMPPAAQIYVVVHEYCHFLQPNHGRAFWAEVEKLLPDWKARRGLLK